MKIIVLATLLCLSIAIAQQTPLRSDQIIEKTYPSLAMLLIAQTPGQTRRWSAFDCLSFDKKAHSIQVRFKNGETFDQVQLLGVDERRDVAAIKITARLPVLPIASADSAKSGNVVYLVSHTSATGRTSHNGEVSALRLADDMPGAGNGYRLVQFTTPLSPGSGGGVLMDDRGNSLGLILASTAIGKALHYAVPIESVIGLAESKVVKTFEIHSTTGEVVKSPAADPAAPEKSDILSTSKDRDFIRPPWGVTRSLKS